MTNEERDIITRFIERVAGVGGGSVPATNAPLPPVDPEADALIADLLARHPGARYRLAQMAFVQEHALAAAQSRIAELQAQLAARQAAPPGPSRSGFFSGLFGAGAAPPPPPPPQYAQPMPPPYPPPGSQPGLSQPGLFPRGGSGFLGSALATAAGVAGGVVAGNALMSLFSPHAGFGGGAFGSPFAGAPENVTIINENAGPNLNPDLNPWADPNAGTDPNQGNFDPAQAGFDPSQAGFDPSQGGFDPSQADFDPTQGGFDPGNFDPGSFDDDTTQV